MKSDKELKREFKSVFSKTPEKFYPVKELKEKGFFRGKCINCGKNFWSKDESRNLCGDAECIGGYKFIGQKNTKKEFDYISAWKEFEKFFVGKGYLSVKRKPVVARWREDVYWVGASVYGFQPYVVSGEAKPPSNAVIIPQPSLRFNDIDNVGLTGSHYVCFDMLGQLHFEKANEFNQGKYFSEYFDWLNKGMGIPETDLIIHEDAWAGGGNFGPCMEFFAKGLELGNQVYMNYSVKENGYDELKIKVLDMGQGHERIPWYAGGKAMSYETTFPDALNYLRKESGTKFDEKLMKVFLPYSALLNVDEVQDIEAVWKKISLNAGIDARELKEKIFVQSAIYSIAEHSRAALIALNDSAMPSNVGGGYNLRSIIRRAFDLAEQNKWKIDFHKLFELHAKQLKPLYSELAENTENSFKIFAEEEKKFLESREKSKRIIESMLASDGKRIDSNEKSISANELVELYDSQGISPEFVKKEFEKKGKTISIPENFYGLVNEMHLNSNAVQKTAAKKEIVKEFDGVQETNPLYFNSWKLIEFNAEVIACAGGLVALNQTAFYPTSGGQEHDSGTINGIKVLEVFKQNNVIIHRIEKANAFRKGEKVSGKIDLTRRKQLAQHHSGAHLLNGAARIILGSHVWQAGASKSFDKARLDITHYKNLSDEEIKKIGSKVNELIAKKIPVKSSILLREEAEEKFGMRIYQGGFVPGRKLRIIEIQGIDVEACGGTHVNNTSEIELFKIISSARIQDGVIRINFVCGNAAKKDSGSAALVQEIAKELECPKELVPARIEELFRKWREARKALKKKEKIEIDLRLSSNEKSNLSDEDLVKKSCMILSTQPQHLLNSVKKLKKELKEFAGK